MRSVHVGMNERRGLNFGRVILVYRLLDIANLA